MVTAQVFATDFLYQQAPRSENDKITMAGGKSNQSWYHCISLGSVLHLVPKETTPKVTALLRMIGDHRFNENKPLDNNRDAKKSCTLLS